jgi:hypothetical protein
MENKTQTAVDNELSRLHATLGVFTFSYESRLICLFTLLLCTCSNARTLGCPQGPGNSYPVPQSIVLATRSNYNPFSDKHCKCTLRSRQLMQLHMHCAAKEKKKTFGFTATM